jgi:hypothetical protein
MNFIFESLENKIDLLETQRGLELDNAKRAATDAQRRYWLELAKCTRYSIKFVRQQIAELRQDGADAHG